MLALKLYALNVNFVPDLVLGATPRRALVVFSYLFWICSISIELSFYNTLFSARTNFITPTAFYQGGGNCPIKRPLLAN